MCGREAPVEQPEIALLFDVEDSCGCIDMPLNEMATKGIAHSKRSFDVHASATGESFQRCSIECLGRKIGHETRWLSCECRQADAIDCHALTGNEISDLIESHVKASSSRGTLETLDRSELLNEACEHFQLCGYEVMSRSDPTLSTS